MALIGLSHCGEWQMNCSAKKDNTPVTCIIKDMLKMMSCWGSSNGCAIW